MGETIPFGNSFLLLSSIVAVGVDVHYVEVYLQGGHKFQEITAGEPHSWERARGIRDKIEALHDKHGA